RQRTNAPVERAYVTMLARTHRNFVHVTTHAFVSRKIIIDHFARFLTTDTDALRQTPGLDRVSDREVDDLGKPARFLQLFVGLCFEDQPRRARVYIFAVFESI